MKKPAPKQKPGRKPIPAADRKRPRSIALSFDEWNFVISETMSEGTTVSAYISKLIKRQKGK